jgi:glycosyltransferase involved in cell wall biosynthesis
MAVRRLRRLAGLAVVAPDLGAPPPGAPPPAARAAGLDPAPASAGTEPGRPCVSVVVPVFNALRSDAAYLGEALESVAAQSWPPLELIVVDDGSEDASLSVVAEFAGRHPELETRVVRQANRGQSSARNAGAAVAAGEWLAFLDQDDVWLPDRLEAVAGRLTGGADLVYTDADTVDARGEPEVTGIHRERRLGGEHPIRSVPDALFRDVFVLPGTMTVRAAFFRQLGGFDETLSGYEDDDLFVRAVTAGRIDYVARSTLLWRMYGGNYSYSHRMVASRVKYWRKLMRAYGADTSVARRLTLRFYRECLVQCTTLLDAGEPLALDNFLAAQALSSSLGPVDRAAFGVTRWAWTRSSRAGFLARWWLLAGLEGRA